ncbi:MAG TPA: alpha/beta hydrolase [Albitalea sp.]
MTRGSWQRRAAVAITACLCASMAACAGPRPGGSPPSADRVADSAQVDVGDARVHVEVHGDDAKAPLMVWLHGGPGGAARPLFRLFNGDLERHLLVAYYDQRGAGRSFDPQAPVVRLTVAQHVADLDRVVDHLRSRYHRRRILLVGHSWGATLGMLYAKARPEKVSGVIGVAPAIAFGEQQRREYAYNLAQATRRGDRRALKELGDIGPPPYRSSAAVLRLQQVTDRHGGVGLRTHNRAAIVLEGIWRGFVTPGEIVRILRGNRRSLEVMHEELLALDLRREVSTLDVPVFFFLGRHDRHADAELSAAYFESLRAPSKQVVWFERSAHDIPFDEPAAFHRHVMEAVTSVGGAPSRAIRSISCSRYACSAEST